MFNHWFALGAIPGHVTKSDHFAEESVGHSGEGLDNYRTITLLNTKILVRVLANRLRVAVGDLIGTEQTYSVKGKAIQNNLHLVCEILERIDDNEAVLINLDQSKALDQVGCFGNYRI